MNSLCNVCGASFKIASENFKTIKDGDILFSYFVCPECGTAYLYLVTDKELRRRIKRGIGRNKISESLRRDLEQRHTPRFAELVEKAYKPKASDTP